MAPLPLLELQAMLPAAHCPRRDNARYLGDCIIRALYSGIPSGRPDDFRIEAGIGVYEQRAGQAIFTPAPLTRRPRGLGDVVEGLVKPIARGLGLPCLAPDGTLRPASPCAQRRDALNRAVPF